MWFCPFLTFSLLLAQRSVLVGLGFFGSHRAIYLHWRNLRAESWCCLQTLWEPPDDLSVSQSEHCLPLLQTSPCVQEVLVCQRWVSDHCSQPGDHDLDLSSLPPTSSAGCPLAASHAVPSEPDSLVSEDAALRAEFGSSYLGLHMHLAVSSSPPASWDSITPLCSKSSQRTEGAKI